MTQVELIEMKIAMSEIQNTLIMTEGRLDIAEEMINECENIPENYTKRNPSKNKLKKNLEIINELRNTLYTCT